MSASRQDPKILEDETELSEISLQADGRVYVFGMTREILEILAGLDPQNGRLQNLLVQPGKKHMKATGT
jgi:hypothetical protein